MIYRFKSCVINAIIISWLKNAGNWHGGNGRSGIF